MLEFVFDRIFGLDDAFALTHAGQRLRQPVIGLRTDHQVDDRGSARNLVAFSLRDTAGNADSQLAALFRSRILHLAQTSQRRIKLFRSFLANMTGIDQHQIGIIGRIGRTITLSREAVGHALAVIDIHLAAIGLHIDLARVGKRRRMRLGCRQCCPAYD